MSVPALLPALLLALSPPATSAPATSPAAVPAPTIAGDYLEVRTCDVYTGPCFANGEVGALGKEATVAWSIDQGSLGGVDLAGLSVVAVIQARATLGDPFHDPEPSALVLFMDDQADLAQRSALRAFAQARLGDLGKTVTAERIAKIDLAVQCCDKLGCATLTVGDVISVNTRCVCEDDIHCGNEYVYYPPLTEGLSVIPAVAIEHRIESEELRTKMIDRDRRGAFTGVFSVGPTASVNHISAVLGAALMSTVQAGVAGDEAAAPAQGGRVDGTKVAAAEDRPAKGENDAAPAAKFRLIDVPVPDAVDGAKAAPATSIPKEVPAAFASLLDPKGLRLVGEGGEAIYDLWFRREVPLGEKPVPGMRIRYSSLELGGLVGVLRSYGHEVDYRESELPRGVYTMRFAIQPEDGDHMGTAETRDFLVLSNFEEDRTVEPVSDMVDLGEMSILSSSTEHPLICYLVVPDGDAPKASRMYRHADREEWIADVTLVTRAKDAEDTGKLRVGVVLIGISEHF